MTRDRTIDYQILSPTDNGWSVRFRISARELHDQQVLLRHLRSIKASIAREHELEDEGVVFDGIVRKLHTAAGVDVIARIRRAHTQIGRPRITFRNGIAVDGSQIEKMTALLDVFAQTEKSRPIEFEDVLAEIRNAGIDMDLVNPSALADRFDEVKNTHKPCCEFVFACGRFPDVGRDAEVELSFSAAVEPGRLDRCFSSRKVKKGDVLCRTIPATTGERPGRNVLGEELPPRTGLDIELRSGSGTRLSPDRRRITALEDGVAVVRQSMRTRRTLEGLKEIPSTVMVKVNPILSVRGNRLVELSTSRTIEVVGELSLGSKVLTDCEVFISGNVEKGTLIEAGEDITIKGSAVGTDIKSDTNVMADGSLTDCVVSAGDQVLVAGSVCRSKITGDNVDLQSVAGSNVTARGRLVIGTVTVDETETATSLTVGHREFFARRIAENTAFLARADQNLKKFERILGPDIVDEVDEGNQQSLLFHLLSERRLGQDPVAREQAEVYRKILETIPPLMRLMEQKLAENEGLRHRLADETASPPVIIVNRIAAPRLDVCVDGVRQSIERSETPIRISLSDPGSLEITREH